VLQLSQSHSALHPATKNPNIKPTTMAEP